MKKKKVSDMSRAELESELQFGARTLVDMRHQSPKALEQMEKETKHNDSKSDQLRKLFIERQAKHDIFEEKLKFYQQIGEKAAGRKRPDSNSFVHSSKSRKEILGAFLELFQRKPDKRYSIAIQILKNEHIKETEQFEALVTECGVNKCILDSINKRKEIHQNYEQIHQLYEALYAVALPDSDEDREHNAKVQRLTAKLDKVRGEYMKRLSESSMLKELKEKVEKMEAEIEPMRQKKKEMEEEKEKQDQEQIEHENHMFELQLELKQLKEKSIIESNDELRRKIEQLNQLTIDVKNQSKDVDEQLDQLREDFDVINGPFKDIINSCSSDPFDDPAFVALFNIETNNEALFQENGSQPNEIQIRITELEDQIDRMKNKIDEKQRRIEEVKKQIEEKKEIPNDQELQQPDKTVLQETTKAANEQSKESLSQTNEKQQTNPVIPNQNVMPKFTDGAPNAQLSPKHMSSKKNEIVIFVGEYNFDVTVVGKHSVPALITSEVMNMKASCETRLSLHHRNFKAGIRFVISNDSSLHKFIDQNQVIIRITAGKTELCDIGYAEVSLLPFTMKHLQVSQMVSIKSMSGQKIGTLCVECACRRQLV